MKFIWSFQGIFMYLNHLKTAKDVHGCMICVENRSNTVAVLISLTL